MSYYSRYYDEQIGGGSGVRNVFAGSSFQRGRGVGSCLGDLIRDRILPYVRSGAKAVGKETLRAGMKVINDVVNNGVNFKESIKSRAGESRWLLQRKASEKPTEIIKGSGYKTTIRVGRQRQSTTARLTAHFSRIKRKNKKLTATAVSRKIRKANKRKRKTPTFLAINDIFALSLVRATQTSIEGFWNISLSLRSPMRVMCPSNSSYSAPASFTSTLRTPSSPSRRKYSPSMSPTQI